MKKRKADLQKGAVEWDVNGTQEERLDFLLDAFKHDSGQYQNLNTEGCGYDEKRRILRSLMNIRLPKPMRREVLKVQDEFLKKEVYEKGIVPISEILSVKEAYRSQCPHGERMAVWQGDITRLAADAIVNAANSRLLGCFVPCHGCIDNAIHSAAGIQLREECSRLMEQQGYEEETGKAKLTNGYNLPCRYVIHTVGPIVRERVTERDCELLRSCYSSCMETAKKNGLRFIA